MKHLSAITLLLLCCLNVTQAQDYGKKSNKYKTWITLTEEPFEVNGILYELRDSTLLMSNYKTYAEFIVDESPTIELNIGNIELIETRKRSRLGTGILIGTASGFALGGLIGLARGDDSDSSAGEKAIKGGISLAIPGALIGMLVGSIKVSFPIDGSLANYKNKKKELRKYSTN